MGGRVGAGSPAGRPSARGEGCGHKGQAEPAPAAGPQQSLLLHLHLLLRWWRLRGEDQAAPPASTAANQRQLPQAHPPLSPVPKRPAPSNPTPPSPAHATTANQLPPATPSHTHLLVLHYHQSEPSDPPPQALSPPPLPFLRIVLTPCSPAPPPLRPPPPPPISALRGACLMNPLRAAVLHGAGPAVLPLRCASLWFSVLLRWPAGFFLA